MQILITGATGFVGRHVVRLLQEQGHGLALLVRNSNVASDLRNRRTTLIQSDLGNFDAAKSSICKSDPDVCIHLAWEGIPDFSQQMSRFNLEISAEILSFILDNTGCNRIIVAGSCWEYGRKQGACRESDPVAAESYFAWAKNALNEYLSIKCAEKGAFLNWFRLFYVYGPGQREGSLIPTVIKSLEQSKTPTIKSPMNKNDFVHVTDVAKAFHIAVTNNIPSGTYNLGSGTSTSVYEVCETAERLITGQASISEQLRKEGIEHEVTDFWADMSKTSRTLRWAPSTPLEEGIRTCIHAVRSDNS